MDAIMAVALEEHEEMQKTAQIKGRISPRRFFKYGPMALSTNLFIGRISPRRVFEYGHISPPIVFQYGPKEMQKTAQMKRMEERRTEDKISVHCEELYAPWRPISPGRVFENGREEMHKTAQMKRWTKDDISVHRISPRRVFKNGREEMQKTAQMKRMEERWTENEISVHHEEMQKTELMKLERGANTILAISEQTGVDFPDYSSTFKRGTFALCSQFLHCAGGSYLEDSQHEQQTVNGIYQHTLRTVSHCPTSVSDYKQRAKDKCAEVCTNIIQDDGCSYHCMRDSYKTSLVEFCAKPNVLFEFCPEYDPIGERIQKDIYTLCNPSNPSQIFYRSSDSFFCDQDKCLQLRDAGVSTSVTSLMTGTTPVSGDLDESLLSQYWLMILFIVLAVILCVVLGSIFRLRGRLVAIFRKYKKKENPNTVQDENEQAALHNTA